MGLQEVLWTIQSLPGNWQNYLDIFLVATVFFLILQAVKGTRAATLLRGIAVVLILIWGLSALLNLQAFSWLLSRSLTAMAVALPVIFQEELRRWLDQLGRFLQLTETEGGDSDSDRKPGLIGEICDATKYLSRRRHGALIVIERDTGLQEYINSGVRMNADVTSELLQTIFFPNTALHDGAVIVRNASAVAAACTLPISTARRLPDQSMGLRHRASLGITEVSDAIAIIVSEETGRISLIINGRFIRGIDPERLSMILNEKMGSRQNGSAIVNWIRQLGRTSSTSRQ